MTTEAPPAPRADLPPDYDPEKDEGFETGNGQPAGEAVPDSPEPDIEPLSPQEAPPQQTPPEQTPPDQQPDETPAEPAEPDGQPDSQPDAEADLGNDEPGEDPGEAELALEGNSQLSLTIGGKKPTSSVLKLQGGTISIPKAQFKKGERLRVALDLRIGAVKIEDKIDSDLGTVVSTLRTHTARVEGAERLEALPDEAGEED